MKVTPLSALQLLLFESAAASDSIDLQNLQERLHWVANTLGIEPPTVAEYDQTLARLRVLSSGRAS